MNINTRNLVSMTEANQNFSKVARLIDASGPVIILKNHVSGYVAADFAAAGVGQYAADENVLAVSKRVIAENRAAYRELAE